MVVVQNSEIVRWCKGKSSVVGNLELRLCVESWEISIWQKSRKKRPAHSLFPLRWSNNFNLGNDDDEDEDNDGDEHDDEDEDVDGVGEGNEDDSDDWNGSLANKVLCPFLPLAAAIKMKGKFCNFFFLAVQDSSIGDIVSH